MTTWVALLRGVNVNGVTIRNADLAAMIRGLGHTDVVTVLASGNVRFTADTPLSERASLKARIEEALRTRFDYDAWIVLVTRDEVRSAIDDFPFDAADAGRQPWVVFASDRAMLLALSRAAEALDPIADPVRLGAHALYWNPVKGTTTTTPFAALLARAAWKSTTTTRNLRTLLRITR